MKNRIYFFTGTGNSLNVAQEIAKTLSNCEVIGIQKDMDLELPQNYERIGFVFPNYGGGPPKMVANFIKNMKLTNQKDTYIFAIATYGGNKGGVIAQIGSLINNRTLRLHYGDTIISYPNAVTSYPMIKAVKLFTGLSKRKTKRVIKNILNKNERSIPEIKESAQKRYKKYMSIFSESDKNYNINNDCISCGICKSVCPAKNITIENKRPVFHNECESCMACIQYCPKRAINYKDKTQKRGRYTNPNIGYQVISEYYKK